MLYLSHGPPECGVQAVACAWLQRTFSFDLHIQNACCDFNRAHVRYSIVQLQKTMVDPWSLTHAYHSFGNGM